MILLARETVAFLALEGLLLAALGLATAGAVRVLRGWDFQAATRAQYARERRAALVELVLVYALVGKLLLLPWFAHVLDSLAVLVPGAMCGAGVVHSNGAGIPLLALKIVVLGLAGLWLMIHRADVRAPDHPYLRRKMALFLFLFGLVAAESALDWAFLARIPTLTPVQCCSAIYGVAGAADTTESLLSLPLLLVLLGAVFALALVAGFARYRWIGLLSNLALLVVGYDAVVRFFGTYLYELPTHHCPFCMLQREYGYYGYFLWAALLGGVFFGAAAPLLGWLLGGSAPESYVWAWTWNRWLLVAFALLAIAPLLLYVLGNGVLL